MKKFKFKMQRLLDLREAREEEVKNELAKVLSVQNRERTKQYELRQKIEENKDRFHEMLQEGRLSSSELMMFEKYVDVSLRAIDSAEQRIQGMEPEVNRIREKLVEVSRERKVVEKLKEKQLNEYDIHINREIRKENDDLNQKIYLRRKASEMM